MQEMVSIDAIMEVNIDCFSKDLADERQVTLMLIDEEEVEALKLPVSGDKATSAETKQKGTRSEQIEIEEGEIFSEDEAADSLGEDQGGASESDEGPEGDKEPEKAEGNKEPEAGNGNEELETSEEAGEPDQRRAFPEADDTGKEKENLIDLPEGEDKTGQNEAVQTPSEELAGPSSGPSAKRRQSISPVKLRIREALTDSEGPKVKEKRKEVSIEVPTPSEEGGSTKEESTSERESKRDAKLKRRRIPSKRSSGPEWAYLATNDWSDEFVSLSLENEETELQFGNKNFMDSVD
ncbi:neurofilament medium polypeptide-like [Pleurodeles waltl]|uniref:neurofilament medium polypeptide-like n=1 Tax=Pleurodeles waltl TaxID=8319 RepID=UPI00370951CE